jgi:hypothetical protein
MPYGLPPLSGAEHRRLVDWVEAGAPTFEPPALSESIQGEIERWETFFNDPSPKSKLVARYLYEHLFPMSLLLDDTDPDQVFRLVRSRSAPGQPVDEIATRRPFGDPKTPHVYYRLVRQTEPRLAKTFMPYALNAKRLAFYQRIFIDADYDVDALPGYAQEAASNPLRTFAAIPIDARYRFLLEEAHLTLMAFIKGPVCRGQVALNVIQDRFWVLFVDPDSAWSRAIADAVGKVADDLALPAEAGSEALGLSWFELAQQHDRYVKQKNAVLKSVAHTQPGISPEAIWDGGGSNRNAALTVFRHFDSASVAQGLVGCSATRRNLVEPLQESVPKIERTISLISGSQR